MESDNKAMLFGTQPSYELSLETIKEFYVSIGLIWFIDNEHICLGTGIFISPDLVLTAACNIQNFRNHKNFNTSCEIHFPEYNFSYNDSLLLKVRLQFFPEESERDVNNFALLRLWRKRPNYRVLPLNINFDLNKKQQTFLIGFIFQSNYPPNYTILPKLQQWRIIDRSNIKEGLRQFKTWSFTDKLSVLNRLKGSPIFLRDGNGIMSVIGFHNGTVKGKIKGKDLILGSGQMMIKKLYEKIKEEEKKIQMEPMNIKIAEELFREGNELMKEHRYQEALISFKKGVNFWPQCDLLHQSIGHTYMLLKRNDEAMESFKTAIAINPSNQFSSLNLGIILKTLKRFDEAVAVFQKSIQLRPKNTELRFHLAHSLHNIRQFEEAVAHYKIVVSQNPKSEQAWYNMGICLRLLDKCGESIKCHKQSINMTWKIQKSKHYVSMAVTFSQMGEKEKAIECYRRVIERNQNQWEAYHSMGLLLISEERFQQALDCYKKLIEIRPNHPSYAKMCNVQISLNRIEEALECINRAIQKQPACMQCYIIRGLIYSFLGKFNWAARICLLVLAVYKGKDGYVYFLLALALTKLKRYEEAASIFKRIRMVKGSSNNQMEVI